MAIASLLLLTFGIFIQSRVSNIVWALAFLLLGYSNASISAEKLHEGHISSGEFGEKSRLVRVVSDPIERERSLKLECEIVSPWSDTSNNEFGKMLVYLQKSTAASKIRFGDTLAINSRLNQIPEPMNPDEFNYKRYLGFHQITLQSYADSNHWMLLSSGAGFQRWIIEQQRDVIEVLKSYSLNDRELAIISALLVGYKHYLTADQVNAFASAGAMHVLAVSGLHVGIVFMILNFLLKPLRKTKPGRWISAIILAIALWLYAGITGFSPSVTRAVTMFTFVIVSQLIHRNTSIYNTLATSAFLLLILNPFLVVEVGFQLSYLAVFGIVILQPRIYELWKTKVWILDKIWQITAVSIAAQIATFPLGLLYFHQFPNYFLLSNLAVIPLSMAILPLGIILVVVHNIPVVNELISVILKFFLWLLDWFIIWVEGLPFALIQGIDISIFETYLIFMVVSMFIMVLIKKSYKWQFRFLLAVAAITAMNSIESFFQKQQSELVFYSVKGHDAIDFVDNTSHHFVADSSLFLDEDKMRFHIKHHWWKLSLNKPDFEDFNSKNTFSFQGKTILILDGTHAVDFHPDSVDILYLKERTHQHPIEILERAKARFVLLSPNMDWRSYHSWIRYLDDANLTYWSLRDKGAFVLNK